MALCLKARTLKEKTNMKSRLLILMFVVVCMSAVAAYGHHSFAGTYVEDKTVTLDGKVAEFNIRNPHSFISIEITDKDGSVSRWGGEWGGVTQLSQGGINRFTLKIGDHIVIEGAPARDTTDHKILVRKVTRPATGTTPEQNVWTGRVQ